MQLPVFYTDTFALPLYPNSLFPVDKYRRLRERLQAGERASQIDFQVPDPVTDNDLLLVHTAEYLNKLKHGSLAHLEQRRIGFPWSLEMVERSRRSTGGTIAAARAALRNGCGIHLAGGTHHAFPDYGQGYCVFNDVAVAIRVLQADKLIKRALVVDLDVHQGDGTAAIFAEDSDVFTFSMHGASNFPAEKRHGDLNIALPDGTADEPYLAALSQAIERDLPMGDVDIAFFLAGADPFEGDRFGKLKISKTGLADRDGRVFTASQRHALPTVVVMAGGYAKSIDDIVDIHETTVLVWFRTVAPLSHT